MARNSISLSVAPRNPPRGYSGSFKVRWREAVVEDGIAKRVERSQTVSDKGACDALVGKLRRTLETGEVYAPVARIVTTPGNLEHAAVAWLRWQRSRNRKESTIVKYQSAMARIMGTIRKLRNIRSDAMIPVTVLNIGLFTELRNTWITEDAEATVGKTRKRAACPMRRYDLSGQLLQVWSFAASQPDEYALVPPPVGAAMVLPPVPARPGAPAAPTWAECDAIIRRAYGVSVDLGDLLAGERLTGLRVEQVARIRRRALDASACTLTVEVGKSEAEEAEKRLIPVPPGLIEIWRERLAAHPDADECIFGTFHADTETLGRLWREAETAGEVRPNIVQPITRRKGRPNHAFRAAYMAGLEGLTLELPGRLVREVEDRTIDYLVGHAPPDTRGRSYSAPPWPLLLAAVDAVDPIDMGTPTQTGPTLVLMSGGRAT